MKIFLCMDELVAHFGPGTLLVTLAVGLRQRGASVVVFVDEAVAPDNQYLAAMRAAEIDIRIPGRAARVADACSRPNVVLLVLLLPLRVPLTLADMLYHRRSFARAWRGVRGRLNGMLPAHRLWRLLRWVTRAKLSREHRRGGAALVHAITGRGAAFGWARQVGLPIVYTENIVPSDDQGVDWWVDVRRHIDGVRLIASVCAAATPAIRSALGYAGPIVVVPPGIADPAPHPAAPCQRDPRCADAIVIGSAHA